MTHPPYQSMGVESADVAWRAPVVTMVGMTVLVAISLAITWGIYAAWSGPVTVRKQAAREQVPAENRPLNAAPLSANQRAERQDYEAEQQERLTTYGWVDREAGRARIPIERAMDRLVEQADQQREDPSR